MSTNLGHFKSKPTARALFNEADKQVGWVFVENSLGHPLNLIISLAESEYRKSPYCSHSVSDLENISSYQQIFHNPSYTNNPLYGGSKSEKFNARHKSFYFKDFPEWHEFNPVDTQLTPLTPNDYGLLGFCYIDNEKNPTSQNPQIEIYLEDNMFEVCVKKDLLPNLAYWEQGGHRWFNLNIPFTYYTKLLNYEEPIYSIYHSPTLSWHEPELSFTTALGLFNWLHFEEQ